MAVLHESGVTRSISSVQEGVKSVLLHIKVTLYDRRISKICHGLVKEVVGGIKMYNI